MFEQGAVDVTQAADPSRYGAGFQTIEDAVGTVANRSREDETGWPVDVLKGFEEPLDVLALLERSHMQDERRFEVVGRSEAA